MKRIDYFWPRTTVAVSGVLFMTNAVLTTTVGWSGKWLWLLSIAFGSSLLYALVAIVINTIHALDEKDA